MYKTRVIIAYIAHAQCLDIPFIVVFCYCTCSYEGPEINTINMFHIHIYMMISCVLWVCGKNEQKATYLQHRAPTPTLFEHIYLDKVLNVFYLPAGFSYVCASGGVYNETSTFFQVYIDFVFAYLPCTYKII